MLSYLETRKLPGIWYQVDGGDGDPATFFYYLGLAARKAAPRKRKLLPLLTPEYLPDLPGFARRFFRQLYSLLPATATLVLDNYQEVDAGSIFHGVMQEALAELRDGINVIVISRTEPPSQYARALANNLVGQIGWDELRLTLEETTALAGAKQKLDHEVIRSLQEQSNGWAAGLVLMLERFKRTGAVNSISQSETMATVFNYFAGQVFDQASAETRDLLMRTAFPPRITIGMAEELTGNAEAGKVLDYLYRRHLFTDRRTGDEISYQYHALFREFLLSRALQSFSPNECKKLIGRCAALLQAAGQIDDAVILYQKAGEWIAVAHLILQQASELVARGRQQTLRIWIGAMPSEAIETQPWLLFWLGICDLAVNPAKAREVLVRAFEIMKDRQDVLGQIMAASSIIETYYLEWANFTALDKWISALEQLLPQGQNFPTREIELRALCGLMTAAISRQPHHPMLPVCAERVTRLLDEDLEVNQLVTAGTCLLHYYSLGLEIDKTARVVGRIQPLLNNHELAPIKHVAWLVRYARHCTFLANLGDVTVSYQKALAIIHQEGLHFFEPVANTLHLITSLGFNDSTMAQSLVAKLDNTINPSRRIDVAVHNFGKGWIAFQRGDLANAMRHWEEGLDVAQEAGAIGLEAIGLIGLADGYCELGDIENARQYMQQARSRFPPQASKYVEYRAHIVEANFALNEGDLQRAREQLRLAIAIGKQKGYANTIWSPRVLVRMYGFALEHDIEVEYVQQLIRARDLKPESPDIGDWPWPIKLYTLGRFAVVIDDAPLRSTGKAQRKPLELLKALVALGGREVGSAILIESLWPNAEGDAAQTVFDSTLHRLRRLLGRDDAIVVSDGKLTLNPQIVWVDVWAFERLLGKSEDALKQVQGGGGKTIDDKITEPVFRLYQGHFLNQESDQPWMLSMREKLRSKFLRHLVALGRHWEAGDHWDKAAEVYQRGLELDNLAEELYRRLMITYQKRNQVAGAIEVYRRCRHMLSIVLGIKPSPETELLYQSLKDD